MEKLINKWFLGGDRPTTPYTYQYASGSLFQNGISYQDVRQGAVSDCYFLASLAETAFRSPSKIQNMFTDNGDNTYSIRLYNKGVADYVTVDRYLPTWSGALVYANLGNSYSNSSNELWVALAEKAYAQVNESGWIAQDNTNSYEGISGGSTVDAFRQITGSNSSWNSNLNFTSIVNTFNSGQLTTLATKSTGVASNIVANHAYAVVGYDSSTQKLTLYNPWGINNGTSKPGVIQLTWDEIRASFGELEYTTS